MPVGNGADSGTGIDTGIDTDNARRYYPSVMMPNEPVTMRVGRADARAWDVLMHECEACWHMSVRRADT